MDGLLPPPARFPDDLPVGLGCGPSAACRWQLKTAHFLASFSPNGGSNEVARRLSAHTSSSRVLKGRRRRDPLWPAATHSDSLEIGLSRGVRAWSYPPDPRDRLELRQSETAGPFVTRPRLVVQSEFAPRAPTPWTRCPSASEPAASAASPSPSARPVTAATPTARSGAAPSAGSGPSEPPGHATSAASKAGSTTATASAPTAGAAA